MGKDFCVGLLKLSQSYSIKLKQEYFNEPCFCASEKEESTDERWVSNLFRLQF